MKTLKQFLKEDNSKISKMKEIGITPEKDFLLWNRVNAFIPLKFFNEIKGNEENIKKFNYWDKKKTIEKDWIHKYVLNKEI